MDSVKTRNRRIGVLLGFLVAAMVSLAFASVPLYKLFCQVTGYGGTPQVRVDISGKTISDYMIDVRFDANTNKNLPWRFKPSQNKLKVRLGEPSLAFYQAHNTSNETITGTAVFNVTPYKAATYFAKIDCFCFAEQTLKPGEKIEMPVEFFVDPSIFTDPNTEEVRAITLSYTFYRSEGDEVSDSGKIFFPDAGAQAQFKG